MNTNLKNITLCLLFFFLIIGLIFYRGPCFLTEGIFEINEYQFYKYSKENGILKGLIFIYPGAGYFKLWTNIANAAASPFSIDTAKIITSYFSLTIYLLIFVYIFFFKSLLFLNIKHKIFAIFVILFSPVMTPEIWMGSAHIREYFGIFAFILLFYDSKNENLLKKFICNILIIISFLSSVWAIVLTPIYFMKFYFYKNKENLIFFISSFFSSLIHPIIIIYTYFLNPISTGRFQIEMSKIYSFLYNVPVRSFFGSTIPKFLFLESKLIELKYFNFTILIIFIFLIIFLLFYIIKKKDLILNLIIASFVFISIFSLIGSLYSNFAGGRYAVIPGVILIFFVYRIFIIEKNLFLKGITGTLLLTSLFVGLIEFKYKSPMPTLLNCSYYETYE